MAITIRPARLEDADQINGLSEQLGYPLSREETRQYLELILNKPGEAVFVAESNQTIIGWIGVYKTLHLVTGYVCEIAGLVIDQHHHRLGAGKLLLDRASTWTAAQGCKLLRVRTNKIRTEAHKFYEKLGFKEVKEQKVYETKLE